MTQIKLTEMKTKMSEMKTTVDGIIGELDITEENIGELESIAIETIQNERGKKRSSFPSYSPMKRT